MAQEYSFLMKDLQASLEEVGLLCNECTCILLLDCLIGYLVEVGPWSGGGAVSEGGAGGGEGTAEGEGSSCFQNFIKLNAICPTPFPSVLSPLCHTFSAATHSVGVAEIM